MSENKLVVLTPMDKLDPRQRLAVDFYTNPLYRSTFGNKTAAALAAGYSGNGAAAALNRPDTRAAIAWVHKRFDEDSHKVAEFLQRFSIHAAHKLVQQMGADEGVSPMPMPEGILDEPEGEDPPDPFQLKRAAEISKHNRAVAALMRETREALKLVLAYHLGTPENAKRDEKDRGSDPLNFDDLNDDELRDLIRHVQTIRTDRANIPEAEIISEEE